MSTVDLHQFEKLSTDETVSLKTMADESMKGISLQFIQDPKSQYTDYQTQFDCSARMNAVSDYGEDYLAIPWMLVSTSATGFAGTETLSWRGSAIDPIYSLQEQGQGNANQNYYQENAIPIWRNATLPTKYTVSAGESTLEEIGFNLNDAAAPATTPGYAFGSNSGLIDRQEFFMAQATYSSGVPPVNLVGTTAPAGFWFGIDYVRMKFICDYRAKAGLKDYPFQLNINFSGGGNNSYAPICVQGGNVGTVTSKFVVGNQTQQSIQYWYRSLELSDSMRAKYKSYLEQIFPYETYVLGSVNLLSGANPLIQGTQTQLNLAQGLLMPSRIGFMGVASGANSSYTNPSPLVTSARLNHLNILLNGNYVYNRSFDTLFQQWDEFASVGKWNNDDYNGMDFSFQKWSLNPIYFVNSLRYVLSGKASNEMKPVNTPINVQLEVTQSNSGTFDGFTAVYYLMGARVTNHGSDKSVNLLA